LNLICIIRYPV